MLSQPKQPPIDAVDVTRECPWTKWGLLLSQILFRMTPAHLNAMPTAKEELNGKRREIQMDHGENTTLVRKRIQLFQLLFALVHLRRGRQTNNIACQIPGRTCWLFHGTRDERWEDYVYIGW